MTSLPDVTLRLTFLGLVDLVDPIDINKPVHVLLPNATDPTKITRIPAGPDHPHQPRLYFRNTTIWRKSNGLSVADENQWCIDRGVPYKYVDLTRQHFWIRNAQNLMIERNRLPVGPKPEIKNQGSLEWLLDMDTLAQKNDGSVPPLGADLLDDRYPRVGDTNDYLSMISRMKISEGRLFTSSLWRKEDGSLLESDFEILPGNNDTSYRTGYFARSFTLEVDGIHKVEIAFRKLDQPGQTPEWLTLETTTPGGVLEAWVDNSSQHCDSAPGPDFAAHFLLREGQHAQVVVPAEKSGGANDNPQCSPAATRP